MKTDVNVPEVNLFWYLTCQEKKWFVLFNPIFYSALSWRFLFFNNCPNDNKAPRHLLPFEFAAEKIPCLKSLEIEFYLITCIFEVDNYFAEHLDGYFSKSSLKMLFWLWGISTEESSLFPPKLRYNDSLHLGRFFSRSMFYSSVHQTINWFCLIVTLFIPHRLGSPTVTGFFTAFPCALEISRKKVPERGGKKCKSSNKAEGVKLKQIQGEEKSRKNW